MIAHGRGSGIIDPAGGQNPLADTDYEHILRNDLASFTIRTFYELHPHGPFLHAPFIDLMVSRLVACLKGDSKRLIITLPPRHLKSLCVSVAFAAWLLGHHPSKHVICASYGQELAEQHARDCRTIMRSAFYRQVFGPILGPRQAVHDFDTIAHGSRRATSVGGPLTGLGADILILDDVQTPNDVLSDVQRRSTNQWFDNTLMSRLNNPETGIIIIVMQRLHQDDFYLIDVFRRKLEYPSLREAVIALADRFKANVTLIEDKASGTQLIQDLEAAGLYGIKGVMPLAGVDKIMRFRAQSDLFASGRVVLPTEAPWLADYVDEIVGFPGTRFNDQVDSTAQALEFLRGISNTTRMWEMLAD